MIQELVWANSWQHWSEILKPRRFSLRLTEKINTPVLIKAESNEVYLQFH